MNKIYKVIWSKVRNCYVAVSEIAKRNGKGGSEVNCDGSANRGHAGMALSAAVGATLLAGMCSVLLPVRVALAAPVMPTLDVGGKSAAVTIASTSSATSATMNINSTQTNNVLKWIDFSVGKGGAVNFTDSHNYLNYVTGHGRSEIDGTLTGAGNIYLINPNGILFDSNASVDVGNLYLSTRSLTDAQLNEFANSGTNPLDTTTSSAAGDIINLGRLNANNITVEGNNISFKNVEEVTPTTAVNVRASGEVHVGYAASEEVNEVNSTQYTEGNITRPDAAFAKWNVKQLNGTDAVADDKYTEYMLVRNANELQNMQNNLTGNYMLANDVDFNDANFNFKPIGYTYHQQGSDVNDYRFSGKFDGLNYRIKNLTITDDTLNSFTTDSDAVTRNIGLFGINIGVIENVGVVDTDINVSKETVGGIVGWNYYSGIIRNVYHTGSVIGNHNQVGGIAGSSYSKIENAYNTGTIDGSGNNIGGIVGTLSNNATIRNVYNTGAVGGTHGQQVGGIAGYSFSGTVIDAYNTGTVTSTTYAGGIIGIVPGGTTSIQNTYNIGIVNGNSSSGGIVGRKGGALSITSSFSNNGSISYGGVRKTDDELKQTNTFAGWSISNTGGAKTTWRISEGQTTPQLTAFLKTKDYINKKTYDGTADVSTTKSNVTTHQAEGLAQGFDYVQDVNVIEPKELMISNVGKVYDGTENVETSDIKIVESDIITGDDVKLVAGKVTGLYADKNAGTDKAVTYTIADDALTGAAAGNYIISAAGTGDITAKELTVTFADSSKTYDGTTSATAGGGTLSGGIISGDTVTLDTTNISAVYADENAGAGNKTVNYSGIALAGTDAGNYSIADTAQNTTSTIDPKEITVTFAEISKTYDGTREDRDSDGNAVESRTASGVTGIVDGEIISVTGKATYSTASADDVNSQTVNYSELTPTGTTASNYTVTVPEGGVTGSGKIFRKKLTVGNITKVYDGTEEATITKAQLIGLVNSDTDSISISSGITASYTGDKAADAGTEKTVNYSDLSISGDAASNYSIATSGTSTAGNSITKRPLSVGSVSKVYDGTDDALLSAFTLTNAIEDDLLDLGVSATSAKYNSGKNVGDNLTVTYSDLSLSGAKSGNYTITSDAVVEGNSITPKELTLVADKVRIKSGETKPSSFTGDVLGFVEGEGLASEDDLKFELPGTEPTMAGSYAIVGKLKDSASGDYQANGVYRAKNDTSTNYTFSNAPANEKAFTIAVDVMPQLDYRGGNIKAASPYVTIDDKTTANTMDIKSTQSNNVLKWIDFSVGSGGTVQFDYNNYLNYVTGHGRSEIDGIITQTNNNEGQRGSIYLVNPNGILFGSDAQVDVGNLYLSTRSLAQNEFDAFTDNGTNPLGTTVTTAAGDIANLGTLKADNIMVEGNNVSFKNYADVIANNINVRASGEVHVGYAYDATAATAINSTEYKNPTEKEPNLTTNWSFKGLDNETSVTPVKYMLVRNAYELQNINNNLTGNYMLANDIDFIDENGNWIIRNFKSLGSKGNYWGSRPGMFQGRLDGLNHVIRNINITNTKNESYSTDVGIIGSNAGIVENFGVVNGTVDLSSKSWVGGIVGANKACGIIRNVYFSGSVVGNRYVGGIAGSQDRHATQDGVDLPGGIIEKAYASGTVRSNNSKGDTYVGGIAGYNGRGARVSEAYNTAKVTGRNYTGGIAGTNDGSIINAYNTGTIDGGSYVGGIAGSNSSYGSIQNTYNTGIVNGIDNIYGGIVGNSATGITASFFTQGRNNGVGTLIDDSQLKQFATFEGTSLASNMSKEGGTGKVWRIYEGQTGPLLTAFLKTKDVVTATEYNGAEQAFDNTLAQGAANHIYATDSGNLVKGTDAGRYLGNNTDPNNDTGYKVYYSDQGGYDIGDTILVIQPKKVAMNSISNVYDGNVDAIIAVTDLSGVLGTDTSGLTISATSAKFADKNVGENKVVTYSGLTLSGTKAENYIIAPSATGAGKIDKREISVSFGAISKTYDGLTTSDTIGARTFTNVIDADTGKVDVTATATYDEKNVGNRTVDYSAIALTGDEANNYSLTNTTASSTGTINKRETGVSFGAISKTYDGLTASDTIGARTFTNVIAADADKVDVTAKATYDEKNAGNRTVDYSAIALTGDEANNYSLTHTTASSTGTIDKKSVTATFADISKIYDGTTNATPGAGTLTGVIAADEGKVNVSATDVSYDEKNAGNRTVNYTGVTLSGAEAGNYSIATTATGNGTIGRKALELVADPASTEYGDYNPASFTGRVDGFVAGESVSNGDSLQFALSDLSASAVGSYGITGTINGSSSGDYGLNYSFTNAASNANAFVIYARPASVQDMVLSDIIPGIKGMTGANISVTALDNAMEQARDKRAEVGIEFAVAQTILSVDADRKLSLENRGMKQPPAMTPQEVAEQVHAQQGNGNGVAAQAGGNAGAASAGANENGAASNAGVAGAVNAAMDVVQQTDDAVGTEESKRKKGVA